MLSDGSRFRFRNDSERTRVWQERGHNKRIMYVQGEVYGYRDGTIMAWSGT